MGTMNPHPSDTTHPGMIATLCALYVVLSRSFKSRMTRWNGFDIKFNDRFVNITEYS